MLPDFCYYIYAERKTILSCVLYLKLSTLIWDLEQEPWRSKLRALV
jgi:hypothetical protein